MEIRTVTVELLRAGPRHNQLISPLTQYLGVCGNYPAGRVTLPYEHGELERRLQELRYRVADQDDRTRRNKVLEQTGREVADILAAIPGVSGMLSLADEQHQTLTHLRIMLSASELAMLPFEASKVPSGETSSTAWLALQARSPVCITRQIRSVSVEGIVWPSRPRILFIAGPDTPFAEHDRALADAIGPWCKIAGDSVDRLVVRNKPSLTTIANEIEAAAAAGKPFTHVHILAHGARLDENDRYSPVGLQLNDDEGVIEGDRLATTLTAAADRGVSRRAPRTGRQRPVVVTLASCDSGQVSDVRTTYASVAHHLHDQGIPLVVASQFPLSVEGSVPFVEHFYQGQLWGEHPIVSLYEVRLLLHSSMDAGSHDWASLVVYEALPSNLTGQLEELRYWQARLAQDCSLSKLEVLVADPLSAESLFEEARQEVDAMSDRLPTTGPYSLECAGLRAAGNKRIALAAFAAATASTVSDGRSERLLDETLSRLESARNEYWRAAKGFIRPSSETVQRKSNLHWLLGQVLSLDVVLGRPLDTASLTAARLAADIDLDSSDEVERAWAHVSLSELALLRLADPELPPDQRTRYAEESLSNARRFLELLGRGSEHAFTTARQFQRYVDWWGNSALQPSLDRLSVPKRPHWHLEYGLVPTAKRVVALLRGTPQHGPETKSGRTGKRSIEVIPVPPGPESAETRPAPRTLLRKKSGSSVFSVEMLPADNGDCLWIEYGDPVKPRRVLIDCGARSAATTVASRIKSLGAPSERVFELFVLTHIDSDHINGVLPLFAAEDLQVQFKDIWFNGWRQVNRFLSVKQGEAFSKLLEDPARALPWNRAVGTADDRHPAPVVLSSGEAPPTFDLADGLRITLLSPGAEQLKSLGSDWQKALLDLEPGRAMLGRKAPPPPVTDFAAFDLERLAGKKPSKDPSVANGSSIALLAEFDGRALLLTGDAHADMLAKSIRALQSARGRAAGKLKLDALKLSHHGSGNATTIELLELLDCPRYLISSNGNIFFHPDREAIARVILHGGDCPTLCFNYRSSLNELWDAPVLKERYHYQTIYPSGESSGLRVPI